MLWRAMRASEWDIYPDDWSAEQVQAALRGVPPTWTDTGEPLLVPYDVDGVERFGT